VSGGHSQILLVSGLGQYHRLGSTIDDALGERLTRLPKLLGLGYPRTRVERAALARLILNDSTFSPCLLTWKMPPNFSFSGLKTAVRQQAEALGAGKALLSDQDVAELCQFLKDGRSHY